VLDTVELTMFGLPGGPLFLSRGIISLARTEGQLAGLIAHELSHIALRHATAQATRGDRYQVGAITGRSIGLAVGSPAGGILERGADFSVWTYFLAYDEKYEQQADRLAADLMARAGYDPSDLAVMIQSIHTEARTRSAPPMWAPSHLVTRASDVSTAGVTAVAQTRTDSALRAVQELLSERASPQTARLPHLAPGLRRGAPAFSLVAATSEAQSVSVGDLMQLDVPSNWRRLPAGNTIVLAPEGTYAAGDSPVAATHGIQVGVARSLTGEAQGDMRALLRAFSRNNPRLTWTPAFGAVTIAGRKGLTTTLSHASPATGGCKRSRAAPRPRKRMSSANCGTTCGTGRSSGST
jgi:hypothetical protein